MENPLVSIITPTHNRARYLSRLYECIRRQKSVDFEWHILDDSTERSSEAQSWTMNDPRVDYEHESSRRLMGEKRNELCRRAKGKIIAMLDDDDYYAPHYLTQMLSVMKEREVDFVKLYGFFLYYVEGGVFAYWDMTSRIIPPPDPRSAPAFKSVQLPVSEALGFGFTYVFKKKVWDAVNFPEWHPGMLEEEKNWNEDGKFITEAIKQFELAGIQDTGCSCIHTIHAANSSRSWPEHLLPGFLLPRLFPGKATSSDPSLSSRICSKRREAWYVQDGAAPPRPFDDSDDRGHRWAFLPERR